MSKATEFAQVVRPKKFFIRSDIDDARQAISFQVSDYGGLEVPEINLSGQEALDLADWIYDTFGEEKPAGR